MIEIRPAELHDHDTIWEIFRAVVATGDTYTFPPNISREDALSNWLGEDFYTYVAVVDYELVGTYFIKANQPGLGSHVANAGYMVSPKTQSRGVGNAMAGHSLEEARKMGFAAMQFNFVVSTNERAIELWKRMGFDIVGTLPNAFNHTELGFVDAYVMFREL